MFIIIPKGPRAIPFLMFMVAVILLVCDIADMLNVSKNNGPVVNVQETAYDDAPFDARYFEIDNLKIVGVKKGDYIGGERFCLGQFQDVTGSTHYIEVQIKNFEPIYDQITANIGFLGEMTSEVTLSGTFEFPRPESGSYSDHVTLHFDEIRKEERGRVTRYISDDPGYGHVLNKEAKKKELFGLLIALGCVAFGGVGAYFFWVLSKKD